MCFVNQFLGMIKIFCVLVGVMVKNICIVIKMHWIVHLRVIHFTECKIYTNLKTHQGSHDWGIMN